MGRIQMIRQVREQGFVALGKTAELGPGRAALQGFWTLTPNS